MTEQSSGNQAVRTICIIGAGAAGLAALKAIVETTQSRDGEWVPTVFEARNDVGGIWLPAPSGSSKEIPLTPLYDSLTTNLPHPVMAFTSCSFPPSTHLFPHAAVVQEYLKSYADKNNLTNYIRFNVSVLDVHFNAPQLKWDVRTSDGQFFYFDHLIVCNGHYRIPRLPNTPGLLEWLSSGKATHSAWYRNPHPWEGKSSVLVVGAGPSGQDITSDISHVVTTVIHSVTGATPSQTGNIRLRGRVKRFYLAPSGSVEFEDGTIEQNIDHCILATGYKFTFPFIPDTLIEQVSPSDINMSNPKIPPRMSNSTYHLYPLARHLIVLHPKIPPSSLAFMGLLIRVAPFPLLEAQAAAICHAIANPESLDVTAEFEAVQERVNILQKRYPDNDTEICKAWHRFEEYEQFDYRDDLFKFASGSQTPKVVVADWEKEMYDNKLVLRKVWVKLVKEGRADEFVKGGGEGGLEEWVELMKKMLKMDGDIG